MGKPLSLDLRVRVAGYVAAGHSRPAAGRVSGVGASTVVRLVACQTEGGQIVSIRPTDTSAAARVRRA